MASLLFIGFLLLWLAFLGGTVGSFLNVVVYRVPAGMSVSHPPSRCPRCEHAIRWYDNIPVLGWFWLRGRCRDCSLPISPRYPLVEALTAGMFLAVAWAHGMIPLWLETFATVRGNVAWNDFAVLCGLYLLHMLLLCLVWTAALMQFDGHVPPGRMLLAGGIGLLIGMVAVDYYLAPVNRFGPTDLGVLSFTVRRLVSGLLAAMFAMLSTFFWTWREEERMRSRWTFVELAALGGLVLPMLSMPMVIALAVLVGWIASLVNRRWDYPLLCLGGALLSGLITKFLWGRGGLIPVYFLYHWSSLVLFSLLLLLMTEACVSIGRRREI